MSFDWKVQGKKPEKIGFEYFQWMYLVYCVNLGLYMLDAWERTLFNTCLVLMVSMSLYTTYAFLPVHVHAMLSYFEMVQSLLYHSRIIFLRPFKAFFNVKVDTFLYKFYGLFDTKSLQLIVYPYTYRFFMLLTLCCDLLPNAFAFFCSSISGKAFSQFSSSS